MPHKPHVSSTSQRQPENTRHGVKCLYSPGLILPPVLPPLFLILLFLYNLMCLIQRILPRSSLRLRAQPHIPHQLWEMSFLPSPPYMPFPATILPVFIFLIPHGWDAISMEGGISRGWAKPAET